MERWDCNVLVGHWPFRYLRKNTLADLRELHKAHDITGDIIASLDAVFYNDPLEGDRLLARQLAGTSYRLAATINPKLPALEENVEAAVSLGAAAVRVYPGIHGYALDDEEFLRLCGLLEEKGLPLFLTMRMEDIRLEYLFHTEPVSLEPLENVAARFPALRIVLLSAFNHELEALLPWLRGAENVFFDTCGLKYDLFTVERALEAFGKEHIVFGSQWPLNCFTSTWLKVEEARCSDEERTAVYQNFAKLL